MTIQGSQWIAGQESAESDETFHARNPATGANLDPAFAEATGGEIDRAVEAAAEAFDDYRERSAEDRAHFLETITDELVSLGDEFLERASEETGYPAARCEAERDRVFRHTRQFAVMIREGSWVDARIDTGDPDRKPMPRPDVRSLMEPIGPVAVFGASNFPVAISVLGTDTVSALAAGCPVIVKGHPGHPGTCELATRAIYAAARRCGIPESVFSLVQGRGHDVGERLVAHPLLAAAAFTGSLGGGRALFDVASRRASPIPFYAEMGSVNPVFILPGALRERPESIAEGFVAALTQGVGQFCTNPGLVAGLESDEWNRFAELAAERVAGAKPATMLHAGIHEAYLRGLEERGGHPALDLLARAATEADPDRLEAAPTLFRATRQGWVDDPTLLGETLLAELFGPVSTFAPCESGDDFLTIAERLEGSLSATIHGTEDDLREHAELVSVLRKRTGRLIFNGYPVGLEICHSIHHGGPYPATTHSRFTSVGTRAIERFVRPVCYQDWPDALLPAELRNANPLDIVRLLDGERTRETVV